ncbi:MAG: tetratricopeptide repeat protein, partial [Gemmatimonadota bacterium]
MSDLALCPTRGDGSVVERYLADRMSGAEAEAFEAHYLTCARCQEALRLGAAVRDAFTSEPAAGPSRAATRRSGRRDVGQRMIRFGVGVAAALAAATAAVLWLGADSSDAITRLGRVDQAPVYLGVPVRSAETVADSLFDAAMSAYGLGRYAEAERRLRSALQAGVDPVPARFFLGASELMTGRIEAAVRSFRAVLAAGDTPYRGEARFYLAKALLQR